MIYKFTVDNFVKCWLRKEIAVNADNLKDACMKVLESDTLKGATFVDNTAAGLQNEDGNSIEIYIKDKNEPIFAI